jgi:hypothetical protein
MASDGGRAQAPFGGVMRLAHLAAALLCAGCAGRFGKRQPAAPLELVRVREVAASFSPDGRASFRVRLDVDNPEQAAGSLNALDWEVWIQGRWFAAGTESLAEPLPRGGRELKVELPVVFRRLSVKPGLSSLEVGVRGRLEGSVDGNTVRLPFQRTLNVDSDGAPIFGETGAE